MAVTELGVTITVALTAFNLATLGCFYFRFITIRQRNNFPDPPIGRPQRRQADAMRQAQRSPPHAENGRHQALRRTSRKNREAGSAAQKRFGSRPSCKAQ